MTRISRRLCAPLSVLTCLLALGACGGGGDAPPDSPEAATESAPIAEALLRKPKHNTPGGTIAPIDPATIAPETGSVTLGWEPPVTQADSAAVGTLQGYNIYFGRASGTYTDRVFVAGHSTALGSVPGLAAGTWYFNVTAVDAAGNESNIGHEVSKSI